MTRYSVFNDLMYTDAFMPFYEFFQFNFHIWLRMVAFLTFFLPGVNSRINMLLTHQLVLSCVKYTDSSFLSYFMCNRYHGLKMEVI